MFISSRTPRGEKVARRYGSSGASPGPLFFKAFSALGAFTVYHLQEKHHFFLSLSVTAISLLMKVLVVLDC